MTDKEKAFLEDYVAVCKKHGLRVVFCACCGSSAIIRFVENEELDNHFQQLLERTNDR